MSGLSHPLSWVGKLFVCNVTTLDPRLGKLVNHNPRENWDTHTLQKAQSQVRGISRGSESLTSAPARTPSWPQPLPTASSALRPRTSVSPPSQSSEAPQRATELGLLSVPLDDVVPGGLGGLRRTDAWPWILKTKGHPRVCFSKEPWDHQERTGQTKGEKPFLDNSEAVSCPFSNGAEKGCAHQ